MLLPLLGSNWCAGVLLSQTDRPLIIVQRPFGVIGGGPMILGHGHPEVTAAVIGQVERGVQFYSYLNEPVIPESWGDFPAIPTEIALGDNPSIRRGPVQWPEPHAVPFLTGELQALSGSATAYVPVILAEDAATGSLEIPITVGYQACDDKACYDPTSRTMGATLRVVPAGQAVNAINVETFAGYEPPTVKFGFFGYDFEVGAATLWTRKSGRKSGSTPRNSSVRA